MKKPGPTSSHPPKAKAKQAAEERAQGKTEGAGQEFSRLFEPEIDAAQNHEDHAGGNKIHRVSPNGGEGPIAAVAGIGGHVPGEGVQDFGIARSGRVSGFLKSNPLGSRGARLLIISRSQRYDLAVCA